MYPPPGVERSATNIFVTPLVHSIAHRYFKSQLAMVGVKPKYHPHTPQPRRKDPVITTPLNLGKDESADGSIKYYPSIVFEEQHHYKVRKSVCVSVTIHFFLIRSVIMLPPSWGETGNWKPGPALFHRAPTSWPIIPGTRALSPRCSWTFI